MAGIVAPFLKAANRVTSVSIDTHGRNLACLQFAPEESPYPFIAMVPQNVTEALLLEELRRKGGDVEYETVFASAHPERDSVVVRADARGKPVTIRSSFVVGCDGAHSAVRHWLKMPFEGEEYTDVFLLADVETNESLPANQLQLCPSEFGPLAIFPMSATRRRIVATVDNPVGDAPSLELVQHALRLRAPAGFEARSLHWSSYFKVHRRHVARLREGRFFVAGDAAHIHSPFGGQGMNTGLHDVWNLVWKLDLFLGGHGNQPLLDSYSLERLPVIKSVIETTDRMTRVMGARGGLAQSLRDAVIPMVSRVAPFQHAFVQRLSELGVAYSGSPIVEGPGQTLPRRLHEGRQRHLQPFPAVHRAGTARRPTQQAAREVCEALSGIAELRTAGRRCNAGPTRRVRRVLRAQRQYLRAEGRTSTPRAPDRGRRWVTQGTRDMTSQLHCTVDVTLRINGLQSPLHRLPITGEIPTGDPSHQRIRRSCSLRGPHSQQALDRQDGQHAHP